MTVLFGGQQLVSPAVASQVNDTALLSGAPDVGNTLVVIGASTGGKPTVALPFGSPADAVATLGSGDLVDAITRAFNPSVETGGPLQVIAIRVNPAQASSLVLKDSAAASVITLTSSDYGLRTNQIKAKVEAGSTQGLKLTTSLGQAIYTQDNVYRRAFQVQYAGGAASATLAVTNTSVTISAPSGTAVATLDLNVYNTVQKLVDAMNAVAGVTASVLDGNGAKPSLNGLDTVGSQDIKTAAYTATATLQAAVDWFNGSGDPLTSAARTPNAGTLPAPVGYTYLSGGADGVITNTSWQNAFTVAQTVDAQVVVACSSDPSIQAMTDAHVQFMSTQGRRERRAFSGMPLGTSDSAAIAQAKALNSDRTYLTHLGAYDYDANGVLTLYPPFVVAAMLGGMACGVNPGTSLTNKSLRVQGMERAVRNPIDSDGLIQGGVLCIESAPSGYRVVKSCSTWLTDTKFDKVEFGTGVAVDYLQRSLRDALAPLKGKKGSPQNLALAVSLADTCCQVLSQPEPSGLGVLVGDANSPAYKNITATQVADQIALSLQASPAIPDNYVLITTNVVPYAGSVSAA